MRARFLSPRAICLVAGLILTTLPFPAPARNDTPHTLVIAIPDDMPLVSARDAGGEPTGMVVDFWRLWANKTDHNISFLPGTMAQSIDAVEQGRADIQGILFYSEERARKLDFSSSFISVPVKLFYRPNGGPEPHLDSFRSARIGTYPPLAERVRQKLPHASISTFGTTEKMAIALARNQVDAFIADAPSGELALLKAGIRGKVKVLSSPLFEVGVRAAVRKGRKSLLAEIERGLETVSVSERRQLVNRWLPEYTTPLNTLPPTKEDSRHGLSLSAEEREWLAKHPRIRVGVDSAWAPIEFVEGKKEEFRGISSDYVRIFAEKLGIDMEPQFGISPDRIIEALEKGRIDAVPAAVKTPELEKHLAFTIPYLSFPAVVLTRKEHALITGLEDLAGKRILVKRDDPVVEFLTLTYPDLTLVRKETTSQALKALSNGAADAYIGNLAVAAYEMDKRGLTHLKVASPTLFTYNLSFAVRKEWAKLADILDKVIESLTPKQKQAIKNKWFSVRFEYLDRSRLWKALAITGGTAGFLLLIAFLWNRSLEKQIRERKRLEMQLVEAKEMAEAASEAKSHFLANMSHEIRTPMNAIIGMCHLALQSELTAQQRDYLNKIKVSSHSLLGIINDILDFSKIEAGKLEIEKTPFYLDDILQNLSDLVSIKAGEKGIEILFSVERDVPRMLIGDPLRVGQVLLNLTQNAIKFTEEGEVVIRIRRVGSPEHPCKLEFSITDTGIGIEPEKMPSLFESFSQADSSTTRKYGGTGLGLAISKLLVELMGGTIDATSTPGKGSTFRFTCPFECSRENRRRTRYQGVDFDGMRALVVDDNATVRRVFKDMLESFGFDVQTAGSGQAALDELERSATHSPCDLILIDWKMPGLDGIETTRLIRRNPRLKKMPTIVMITAYGREEIMHRARQEKMDAFLIKPVSPSVLFETIAHILVGPSTPAGEGRPNQPEGERKRLQGKVLLVEDNEINQQVAVTMLEGFGLRVEIAGDGRQAVEAVRRNRYDLVLMDIQLPEMDGFEATGHIRADERFRNLPIIAMTAHAMSGDRDKSLQAGMNDHLPKPIEPDQLFEMLCRWLEPSAETVSGAGEPVNGNGIGFPELPGVDLERALPRVGNNKRLLRKLLFEFHADHHDAAARMREALEQNELSRVRRMAHTLSGVAGNLGAEPLREAALAVEQALSQDQVNHAEVEPLLDRLQGHLGPLMERLEQFRQLHPVAGEQAFGAQNVDLPTLGQRLQQLAELLHSGDSAAVALTGEITTQLFALGLEEPAEELSTHVNDFEFDDAIQTVTEISRTLRI